MPLPEIVTLADVDAYLRLGGAIDEEATLLTLIAAATEAVLAYADAFDPTEEPPARIKLAILTHVVQAFENRVNGADTPSTALSLIRPFRTMDI